MDITKDIQPMTAFRHRSAEFMRHLKQTRRRMVRTVNAKIVTILHIGHDARDRFPPDIEG